MHLNRAYQQGSCVSINFLIFFDGESGLRSAFARALGSGEFQDEAKKKTLEADLLPGEELQALAKEVIVQPPEIIGQIRKLMGG